MKESGTYKIRPAGRLVLTIGRDLIQDVHAAVVELVKNAYDADSPDVAIQFQGTSHGAGYIVTIADNGHGMTREDVITKWMVPSTSDKLDRRTSPSGRVMQGRKGVGRYATSVLGNTLLLETGTAKGEETQALIEWDQFEKAQYLDDVEITVQTTSSSSARGTRLTIEGDASHREEWTDARFNQLRTELRKLQSPIESASQIDDFQIKLSVKDMPDCSDIDGEVIEPFPLYDLFDYRISGSIDTEGIGDFEYSIQKIGQSPDEIVPRRLRTPTGCGPLLFDIRVYDRDSASIRALIGRGLTDDAGGYLGSNEARRLLNRFNGIGVYRHGFRIRPLGDPEFDWLKLNQRRVQNPSMRIGGNQVIGIVQIDSEEISGLVEKSARDGLREDSAFANLKRITTEVISLLETRRFRHRRMMEEATIKGRIDKDFATLLSSERVKRRIQSVLVEISASGEAAAQIDGYLDADQRMKNVALNRLRDDMTRYEGQVTLGKIVEVVLHEGRRPLGFFRNEYPYLRSYRDSFLEKGDEGSLEDIVFVANGMANSAEEFVRLFNQLDPLSARRRGPKTEFDIAPILKQSFGLFTNALRTHGISFSIDCPDKATMRGWSEDLSRILANLIDNSLYWLAETWDGAKMIVVSVTTENGTVTRVDYQDSGPGIDPLNIQNDLIFEPNFSTKPNGTGLGLAIAGEAASRNDMELIAIAVNQGALFRLQSSGDDDEQH